MSKAFCRGLKDSLSIAVGYVPVAISFGLAAVAVDVPAWAAILFSVLVYAGASQFVLVSLISQQACFLTVVAVVWLMNLRHLFYGPALLNAAQPCTPKRPMLFWGAGLTDEVFATAVGRFAKQPESEKEGWYLGLQLGAYLSWVGGTAVGALFGADWLGRWEVLDKSLGFVLPALFFTLLLEIAEAVPRQVLLAAALGSGLSLLIMPVYMAIIVGMFAGCLAILLGRKHD